APERVTVHGRTIVMVVDPRIPLTDPDFYTGDFHPVLAELRARGPVHWHDELGLWAVVGHDAVLAVSRDPATFCSGRGILLSDRERAVGDADSIIYLDRRSTSCTGDS